VIKTQAAKLIESLADHVDGVISFLTTFSCHSINYALLSGKVVNKDCQVVGPFVNSNFLANTSNEIIAETSIVALTTISYILPKRQDLV
jgi:hypothetical protein